MSDWKDRLGVVFSTAEQFDYATPEKVDCQSVEKNKQNLRVFLDKKQRKGKKVTIVANFVGDEEALKDLSKILKTKCGVGGTAKDGEIIIQGDFRDKIVEILRNEGYLKSRII